MVKWGSGVHQWQVTYDQLFHQLYVIPPCELTRILLTDPVGKCRSISVLPVEFLREDGYPSTILASLRAESQRQQTDVVRRMGNHRLLHRSLHCATFLDRLLLLPTRSDMEQVHEGCEVFRRQRHHISARCFQHGIRHYNSATSNLQSMAAQRPPRP